MTSSGFIELTLSTKPRNASLLPPFFTSFVPLALAVDVDVVEVVVVDVEDEEDVFTGVTGVGFTSAFTTASVFVSTALAAAALEVDFTSSFVAVATLLACSMNFVSAVSSTFSVTVKVGSGIPASFGINSA